jgi:hypothetical protein
MFITSLLKVIGTSLSAGLALTLSPEGLGCCHMCPERARCLPIRTALEPEPLLTEDGIAGLEQKVYLQHYVDSMEQKM